MKEDEKKREEEEEGEKEEEKKEKKEEEENEEEEEETDKLRRTVGRHSFLWCCNFSCIHIDVSDTSSYCCLNYL